MRNRRKYLRVRCIRGWRMLWLDKERRHGIAEEREVDCDGNRATSLAFVSACCLKTSRSKRRIVEARAQVGMHQVVWLRCGAMVNGRNGGRCCHGVGVVRVVSVLEGLQRHKLGELSAQHLGVATEVMHQDLRSLLLLCEIAALEETP